MERTIIFIILIISPLISAQLPSIKVQSNILSYIPQIRKQYSITNTQIYPPQIHQAELHKQHKNKINSQPNANNGNTQVINMNENVKLNPLIENVNQIINGNFQRQNPMPQPIPQPLPERRENIVTPQNPQPVPVPTPIQTQPQPQQQTQRVPQKSQQKNKIQFQQFPKLQLKQSKKYTVYNIDDRSVINSQGNIIQLDKKQTPATISISQEKQTQKISQKSIIDKIIQTLKPSQPPIQPQTQLIQPINPIQPQFKKQQQNKIITPTVTVSQKQKEKQKEKEKQRQYNINKILQPIQSEQDITAKLLFTIMLGISILVIVFGYKPDPQKRRSPYIPRNDDEESQLN